MTKNKDKTIEAIKELLDAIMKTNPNVHVMECDEDGLKAIVEDMTASKHKEPDDLYDEQGDLFNSPTRNMTVVIGLVCTLMSIYPLLMNKKQFRESKAAQSIAKKIKFEQLSNDERRELALAITLMQLCQIKKLYNEEAFNHIEESFKHFADSVVNNMIKDLIHDRKTNKETKVQSQSKKS